MYLRPPGERRRILVNTLTGECDEAHSYRLAILHEEWVITRDDGRSISPSPGGDIRSEELYVYPDSFR